MINVRIIVNKCFVCYFFFKIKCLLLSATPVKPWHGVLLIFVDIRNTMCRSAYYKNSGSLIFLEMSALLNLEFWPDVEYTNRL